MADSALSSNNPFRRKNFAPLAASTVVSSAGASAPAGGSNNSTTTTTTTITNNISEDSSRTATPPSDIAVSSSTSARPASPHNRAFPSDSGRPELAVTSSFSQEHHKQYQHLFQHDTLPLRTDQPPTRHLPTGDEFRQKLRDLPRFTSEAPPSTTFLKPKPVKKVRVQSPSPSLPSSPDSTEAGFAARFPAEAPFPAATSGRPSSRHQSSDDDDHQSGDSSDAAQKTVLSPPRNPFQNTLEDLEPEEDKASAKKALDRYLPPTSVDGDLLARPADRKKPPLPSSRHGKLIKAQKEGSDAEARGSLVPGPSPPPPSHQPWEVDMEVNEIGSDGDLDLDEADDNDNDDDNDDGDAVVVLPRPPTPPNASHATSTSAVTSTALTTTSSPPLQTKKSTPVPPPRRNTHTRSESRINAATSPRPLASDDRASDQQCQQQQHQLDRSPVPSGRSSLESTRSQPPATNAAAVLTASPTTTANAAPAPPPRRRGYHAARQSVSAVISPPPALSALSVPSAMSSATPSPSVASKTDRLPMSPWSGSNSGGGGSCTPPLPAGPAPLGQQASVPTAVAKPTKPPPPPTRGASVRRKERRGSGGVDVASRRHPGPVSFGQGTLPPPPPPPPARQRGSGSSRDSVDSPSGPTTPRKGSGNEEIPMAREDSGMADGGTATTSAAILADLDALQREVDALRGQYTK